MAAHLHLGRWQEALAGVDAVDAIITDPPYGAKTHDGHNAGEKQMRSATGQSTRTSIAYEAMAPSECSNSSTTGRRDARGGWP
jgi:23S rRNA G2445 N2-methylase RlmL